MADNKSLKQAQNAFKALCDMLDKDEWHYEKDVAAMKIKCSAVGDDLTIPVTIKVDPDKALVSLYSFMPFDVPANRRRELAVAVSKANDGIVDGSFDYNFEDGTILFRITVSIRDSIISQGAFKYMLYCACATADAYNDKFLLVAKNSMSCDEVAKFIQ